jgi:putative ABC transport system substrate-binding protein
MTIMESFSCEHAEASLWRRRTVAIALLSPFVLPRMPHAQPAAAKTWRIGFVSGAARPADSAVPAVFRTALQELGFEEGRQVTYEGRWIEARQDRLPAIFAELLALRVDLIVTQGAPAAAAAKRATSTVPIVALAAGDIADTGLVASLAKPGGNVTGINDQSSVLSGKRLELLRDAVPSARRVAVLWNAGDSAMTLRYQSIEQAAKVLGMTIDPLAVREPDDFDGALAGMDRRPPDALMMVADALTNLNRQRVIDYAALHRIPAIYEAGAVVRGGGLMSYGYDIGSVFVLGASYVARILRGARPSELPVEQPNRYFLVINLKTARALGLMIPTSLRLRADELVE